MKKFLISAAVLAMSLSMAFTVSAWHLEVPDEVEAEVSKYFETAEEFPAYTHVVAEIVEDNNSRPIPETVPWAFYAYDPAVTDVYYRVNMNGDPIEVTEYVEKIPTCGLEFSVTFKDGYVPTAEDIDTFAEGLIDTRQFVTNSGVTFNGIRYGEEAILFTSDFSLAVDTETPNQYGIIVSLLTHNDIQTYVENFKTALLSNSNIVSIENAGNTEWWITDIAYKEGNYEFPIGDTPTGIVGDINYDGKINTTDIMLFITKWRAGTISEDIFAADTNKDNRANVLDITNLLAYVFNGQEFPVMPTV